MTDVWKSNARKFCELCKVWFADNKVSIEHHEGGQKHKAAIQAKIKELGKKSKQHEREQSALQTTLALMESEARKSMKKDSSGVTSANLPCSTIGPSPKPRTYLDPKAHSSSIAAMAREMALRKKEKCEKQKNTITSSKSATEVEAKKKFDGGTQKKEESRVWVEVRTTDNIPYYFHIYSGEAVWDKPDSYFTPEEYAEYLKTACNTNTHSDTTNISNDVKSEDLKNDIPTPPPNQLQKQSAADERNVCSDAIIRKPMDNYSLHAEHSSSQHHPVHLPPVINTADIPLPDSCPPPAVSELAAISFPKQEVSLAPSDAGSGTSVQEKIASTFLAAKDASVKVESEEEGSSTELDSAHVEGLKNVGKESCSGLLDNEAKISQKTGDKFALADEKQHKCKTSPYGAWTKVVEPPPEPRIDYELPSEHEGRKRKAEQLILPEDMVDFTEKVAPEKASRKKKDVSFSFRKSKTKVQTRKQEVED